MTGITSGPEGRSKRTESSARDDENRFNPKDSTGVKVQVIGDGDPHNLNGGI
jgi:hypothetical protein